MARTTLARRGTPGALTIALLFGTAACDRGAEQAPVLSPGAALESPAEPGSSEPSLAVGPDGVVYLTWQQAVGDGHELRFSTLRDDTWSSPRVIARGADWFVNWADFPSLLVMPDGTLAAHYLRRHGTGATYDYDVQIVQSRDGGESWSGPVQPHRDGVPAEHGFVSLFPAPDGQLAAVWLDGRRYSEQFGGSEEMELRYTTLSPDGELGPELLMDARVCDCCQTAWALTRAGPIVAYRDRSPEEIRDIHLARWQDGGWVTGPVHDDGWHIAACPVNGPALDADGDRVAIAWFTGANDTSRVMVAFSDDSGASFQAPVRVDGGNPAGRVDLVLLDDGAALVSWLERGEGEGAEVRVRRVDANGAGAHEVIAESSQARASGFPRMARTGDTLVFAWTEAGDASRVRVARYSMGGNE